MLLGAQVRAVEDIAIALAQLFHGLGEGALYGRAQVLKHREKAHLFLHGQHAIVHALYLCGKLHLRDVCILADDLFKAQVLFSYLAVLGKYGVVVVGGHVRGQVVVVVGAVHEAKVRAALEHVEVHITKLQHLVKLSYCHLKVAGHMLLVAPGIKPADPELHAHQRGVGPELLEIPKGFLHPGAEVGRCQHTVYGAAVEHVMCGAVGGAQGHGNAEFPHKVPQPLKILLVVGVGAVLIFYLHHYHRAPLVYLQRP